MRLSCPARSEKHGTAHDTGRSPRQAKHSAEGPMALADTEARSRLLSVSRQLQDLRSAMGASGIRATRVSPPQEKALVAPTAKLHTGWDCQLSFVG